MFKCLIVATLIASLIFLIIDVIWLSFATKSFYRPLIGNLLLACLQLPKDIWGYYMFGDRAFSTHLLQVLMLSL